MITDNLKVAAVIDGFTIKGGNTTGSTTFSYQTKAFYKDVGGGILNSGSSPTIANMIFIHNNATYGGGMDNDFSSSPTIRNSSFTNNKATNGGGMYNDYSSSPTITNSTVMNNNANPGGGIFNQSSSPTITNSIIWGNGSTELYNNSSTPIFKNSIIKGSGGSDSWNTAFGTDNGDNLDTDPYFVDAANGDYGLATGSPAINAGDGIFGNSVNTDTLDLAGNPRFIDEIDMETYENQCKEHLILGLADGSLSGIYNASQTITIIGAVEVMLGVNIELSAPLVTIDDSMIVQLGAIVTVTVDGCN